MAVFYPFYILTKRFSVHRKVSLILLFFAALTLYSFSIKTACLKEEEEEVADNNQSNWNYYLTEKTSVIIDTLLTVLIPFIIIIFINALISFKLMTNLIIRKKNLRRGSTMKLKLKRRNATFRGLSVKNKSFLKRKSTYSRTSRVLICIPIVFILLNTPMALVKLYFVYNNLRIFSLNEQSSDNHHINNNSNIFVSISINSTDLVDYEENTILVEQIICRLASYLYYLNFCINFFLYTLNISRFKQAFWNGLTRRKRVQRRDKVFKVRLSE